MNPIRRRRMWLLGLVLLGAGTAIALTLTALNQNIQHFFSPSDIADGKAPGVRTFRLGGIVEEGSVGRNAENLKVSFVVTDRFKTQPVEFTGILPDLFREGQSVVATGTLDAQRGVFVAREVLAKHDENYMPKEVADAIARAQAREDGAAVKPGAGAP
ncbi:MAG: cytochrome c maturation protein CcmE [Pseudomonadota bacterium]